MKRKNYSKEFKLEGVALAERIGFDPAAAELGVCSASLYTWRKKLKEDGADAFPGKGKMKPLEEEARQLRRKVRLLEQDIEILKKAAIFFAKEDRK